MTTIDPEWDEEEDEHLRDLSIQELFDRIKKIRMLQDNSNLSDITEYLKYKDVSGYSDERDKLMLIFKKEQKNKLDVKISFNDEGEMKVEEINK